MFRSRGANLLTMVSALSVISILGGCSSGAGSSTSSDPAPSGSPVNWTSPSQAITEINGAGFDCEIDETDVLKQVITEYPATKEPIGGAIITCDGFQVLLINNPNQYLAELREACVDVTAAELESEELNAILVAGDNYLITGRETGSAFPTETLAQELQQSFGGRLLNLREYYEDLCKGIPATKAEPQA
ncbi:MAG: hypothetical protein OSA11_04450 [Candidatus Nanopelagicales bacterium]|nr:hypothetical protein [Candidatus Nanopelagicales bacterium]